MKPFPPDPFARPLDDFVAAFEEALARADPPDLNDFLPAAGHPLHDKVLSELIRVELEHGWKNGQPRPLTEYRQRFPDFFRDPIHRQEIAFEDYRLRRQAGQNPSPEEYERAHGVCTEGWPRSRPKLENDPVRITLEDAAHSYRDFHVFQGGDLDSWLQSSLQPLPGADFFRDLHRSDPCAAGRLADGLVRLPEVGTEFLGFRLLAELGRGAFGRVFLAEQAALASRLVALKVSPDAGAESQKLAQLQHTHIVPIYSVHRADPLQAVCMPFFGALTLADVLRDLHTRPSLPQSGAELLSTLNERQSQVATQRSLSRSRTCGLRIADCGLADGSSNPQSAIGAPARAGHPQSARATLKKLEGLSYVEAVVWLGSCLADGLAHAHERGILHRDLKPANVLLTDEGQPMLLDFNLAEDTKLHNSAAAALVGGTLPYMAPEHLEAFRNGEREVDARSDVYALGILLYELLTGRFPFANKSTGLASGEVERVVAQLLEDRVRPPRPARHGNPGVSPAVDAILRHCLEPDPAHRYQSARALQEDLQCQLNSRPLQHAPEPLRERFRKRLRRSPRLLPRLATGFAVLMLLLAVGFGLRARYLSRVREAQETLHETEKEILGIRFGLKPDSSPAERARAEERCRSVLNRYGVHEKDWRGRTLFAYLDGSDQNRLAEEFGELLYLLAHTAGRAGRREPAGAPSLGWEERRRLIEQALADNQRAENCFAEDSVPPALLFQRADLLEQSGDGEAAQRERAEAAKRPRNTACACYLAAVEHTLARRYREALPLLQEAVDRAPRNFWAWMMLGRCHDGLGNDLLAVGDYNAAAALAPDFHGVYFNRGLAYYRQGKYEEACRDFDRAIDYGGATLDARINRSLARERLSRYEEALADLDYALNRDASATQLYLQRARVRQLAKDPRAADDLAEGMRRTPGDVRSWNALGNAYLRQANTAPCFGLFEALLALSAFEQGLAKDPEHLATLISKAYVLSECFRRDRDALAVQDRLVQLYPEYAIGLSARGVLQARLGNRATALEDARHALELSRDPFVVYQVGDIYALTSRQEPTDAGHAVVLLHEALRGGFGASDLPTDPDLKPLHHLPEFQRLRDLAARLVSPSHLPTAPGGKRP